MLPLGKVVVALDAVGFLKIAAAVLQDFDDALHHLLPVEQGEFLRPVQVGHIVVKLGRVLHQVGQVGVGQGDVPLFHQFFGDADVVFGQAVADAPGAGVQERPGVAVLVQHNLDEVVAGAQGAQLLAPVFGDFVVEIQAFQLGGFGFQLFQAGAGGFLDAAVVVAGAERHLVLNGLADVGKVVGQVAALQGRFDGNHPAADVHAHGGGDDGAAGGDDGADGGAHTEVAVGHHGDVPKDEGHSGEVVNLLPGGVLDLLGRQPGEGFGADVQRRHKVKPPCDWGAGRHSGRPMATPVNQYSTAALVSAVYAGSFRLALD